MAKTLMLTKKLLVDKYSPMYYSLIFFSRFLFLENNINFFQISLVIKTRRIKIPSTL